MSLFCSDIDGTLLNAQRTLSTRTIGAIEQLRDAGHSFVLCSSRMPASMTALEQLYSAEYSGQFSGGAVPLIAYNGGLVLDASRTVTLDVPITSADARQIYNECAERSLHASFYSADDWFAWAPDRWADREMSNTGVAPNAESAAAYVHSARLQSAPPHKVMCMGDAQLIDEIEQIFRGMSGIVTYRSKSTYLEIASADCSKGAGVRAVAHQLKVDLADCYYFGDNYNDLPAFAVVGTSVAVANAQPSVLAAATEVTAGHHQDGVAVYIENWLARQ